MKTANLKGKTESVNTERRKLLKLLTYERRGRKPIYYRDYKRVLSGELPLEAVMGSGFLQ
ncbi:MAG TPA: Uma2 family endonuclease, partial [Aquifex sp.]|nr:Uma2 family endonuclease [Aquifex sp.]